MAIENVSVTVADETEELSQDGNIYSGEIEAPQESGIYSVSVSAYDEVGNVSVSETYVDVSLWHPPKTDWAQTDRFNFKDYNRIKNNIEYLHQKAVSLWKPFNIEDMGENIYDYTSAWDAEKFNIFERNLEVINNNIFSQYYGYMQTFFYNGPFIKADELNRIESAILSMNDILERQKQGIRRLSFRLGTFKGVKI